MQVCYSWIFKRRRTSSSPAISGAFSSWPLSPLSPSGHDVSASSPSRCLVAHPLPGPAMAQSSLCAQSCSLSLSLARMDAHGRSSYAASVVLHVYMLATSCVHRSVCSVTYYFCNSYSVCYVRPMFLIPHLYPPYLIWFQSCDMQCT